MKSKIVKFFVIFLVVAFILISIREFLELLTSSEMVNESKTIGEMAKAEQQTDTKEIEEESDEKAEAIQDSQLILTAIGDIMCHNSQFNDAFDKETQTYDFSYVFDDVKEATEKSDIFVGNLETTFAGKENGYSNYPTFNSPEQLAVDLKELGVDILTTANNHCMDSGYGGLESTILFLDDAHMAHTGTNRSEEEQNTILVQEENGIKIAFLAFTYGTNGIKIPADKKYAVNLLDEEFVLSQIELAKKEEPDLICASVHWGGEYETKPNKDQTKWADFLIENGVDIILGSHPHVLQPMEFREVELEDGEKRTGFVIYSLGNFMSGQTKTGTRTSIILNLNIIKKGEDSSVSIDSVSYTPIYTYTESNSTGYKILDIGRSIEEYENGEDKTIGENNYKLFKTEFDRVIELMSM